MKKINSINSFLMPIVFVIITLLKQYWLLNELEMKYSNANHIYMSLGASLILLAPFLLLGRKKHFGLFLCDFFFSIVLFCDLIYFRYFSDFITIPVLSQSNQTIDIMDSIINLIKFTDLWIFCSLPLWFLFIKSNKPPVLFRINFILASSVALVGILAFLLPIQIYVKEKGSDLFEQSYSNAATYRVLGIVGFHAFDIKKYLDENVLNKKELTEKEVNDVNQWFTSNQSDESNNEFYGIAKDKNIIVFQAEAFQSFVIGKTINGKEITPNINALVEKSLYFDNIYDQTAQGRTSDAEILVNASLHPLKSGSVHVRFPSNTFDSLANNLEGYTSYSFHGNNKSFWNRYLIHSNLGFDKFYSIEELKDDERVGPFLSDKSLLRQTGDILENTPQPFYSFMVGVSSHHPFNFTKSISKFDVGEYKNTMLGDYIQAINYVDSSLGQFIQQLKDNGLWENSIFVIYGDHNTGIIRGNEQIVDFLGMENESPEFNMTDLRIPLIVHLPSDIKGGTKINTTGGLIDVSPTIFHLLGEEKPKFMIGNSLLSADNNNFVVFRNGGFIDRNFYLDNTNGTPKCYNLNSSEANNESCSAPQTNYFKRIEISDKVIQNNLIKQLYNK